MTDEEETGESEKTENDRLVINFIKSNCFRVIHSDGAWVGLTPSLAVNIVLFSERAALPRRMTHEIDPSGNVGAEIVSERVSKEGLVREMEASVIMQPARVRALIGVLQKMLDEIGQLGKQESPPGRPSHEQK